MNQFEEDLKKHGGNIHTWLKELELRMSKLEHRNGMHVEDYYKGCPFCDEESGKGGR